MIVYPADLADRAFTSREAAHHGITNTQLSRAVRCGALRRPLHGLYVPASWPDDLDHRIRSVGLLLREGHVLVDRSAAWLHGVDVFGFAEKEAVAGVEISVPSGGRAARARGLRGRSRELDPGDVMTAGGVRVTTPLRTALDLACNLRRAEALASLDAFARLHGVRRSDLYLGLERFKGRRGVVQARSLVALMDPLSESPRESQLRLAMIDAGLPVPVLQFVVEVGGFEFRLDSAYPAHRVAVEYDGREFHQDAMQDEHDEWRRSLLRKAGWTVIVVRSGDLSGERLEAWIRSVRNALAERFTTLRW